jgi:hypothetical protein
MSKQDEKVDAFNKQVWDIQHEQGWDDGSTMRRLFLEYLGQTAANRDGFIRFAYETMRREREMTDEAVPFSLKLENAQMCDLRFSVLPGGLDWNPNITELLKSIANEEIVGLVDENSGGIIAYVLNEDRAGEIAHALNNSLTNVNPV